jgi:DNA-binding beta-propeller fold protein YncE
VLFAPWLLACQEPTVSPPPVPAPAPVTNTDTTPGTTAETGQETGEPEVDPDCLSLPTGPFNFQSTSAVQTEEDFDFDAAGYLLTQHFSDLAGISRQGQAHVIASSIGADAAGIRSLVTGDIVVAQPDTGSLRRVDYLTGTTTTILAGLSFPNGIEASRDGMIYSSEYTSGGRIRVVDPYNGDALVIAQLERPNNMALTPDEQTLYVVTTVGNGSKVVALDRGEDEEWGSTPRLIYEHPTQLGGITTDKCGNIYIVEFTAGKVYRLRTDDQSTPEPIVDLTSGSFSSLRFSAGKTDWSPTELFVTNRSQLFYLDVGIAGRHVLSDE